MGIEAIPKTQTIVEDNVASKFPTLMKLELGNVISKIQNLVNLSNNEFVLIKTYSLESFLKNKSSSEQTIFWICEKPPFEDLVDVKYSISKNIVVVWPHDEQKMKFYLEELLKKFSFNLSMSQRVLELRKKNQTLLTETSLLEEQMLQLSQSMVDVRLQEANRSKKIRELVQFIKELILTQSKEDVLELIRQEFKRFHNVLPPMFLHPVEGNKSNLVYFQGKQILSRLIEAPLLQINDLEPKHEESQKLILNLLQRPVSNILALPLIYQDKKLGIFLFENQLNAEQMRDFIQTLAERTYPLEVTMDRFFQQEDVNQISLLWAKTFDDLQDPILIVEKNYSIVRSNKSFGLSKDKKCYEVLANATKPCVGCPMQSSAESNALITVNKKIYDVSSSKFSFESKQGEVHYLHHYAEVTSSKELQGKVIQGEKMAAIGLLAGNIAHELNNPLTGIKSMAEIILKEVPANENVFNDLKEIVSAADRCHKIIQNLLDFSKDNRTNKSISKVNLNEVINKTLPLLKTSMRFHNCELYLSDNEITVLANPYLLQQVVFNLVNNACQAMGDSGTLKIKTCSEGKIAKLIVADDGPGVPPEISKAIFDPFFTTKTKEEGTGLGLSMSLSIIESFQGKLYLNTKVQRGAEFIIELVLAEA